MEGYIIFRILHMFLPIYSLVLMLFQILKTLK